MSDAGRGPDPGSLERARSILARARSVVALTGAGISTDSGIPDFRGPAGVWTKNPEAEKLSTLSAYLGDPEVRRRAWQARLGSPAWVARPNAGHLALVELERRGVLDVVATQNTDGLHGAAGHDPGRVIELHGTMREVVCLRCGDRRPTPEVLERVRAGEEDPACLEPADPPAPGSVGASPCGGILKTATILFGQPLVAEDLARAEEAASRCDVLLAVGSTLSVHPAAGLVPTAMRRGATVVIVNGGPTDYDQIADVVVRGPISEVLPVLVGN